MASNLNKIKALLLKYPTLTLFFMLYTAFMGYLYTAFIEKHALITSLMMCGASLPVSIVFILFLKNGKRPFRCIMFLYIIPLGLVWLFAASVYVYSSFLGGDFFISLHLFTNALAWGGACLGIATASSFTVLLFKLLSRLTAKDK